jgi:branched-chain amino acid transport system permease protein
MPAVSLFKVGTLIAIVACALLPLFLKTSVGLTIGMQVMVLTVFAYSYQLLFGLANLLSFGHAVYFGAGGFLAAHVMNDPHLAALGVPIEAVPLFGLVGGALIGVILGFPTSRSSGTPFAMVTLGIGELVGACILMFPAVFGGEGGVITDRAALPSLFGGALATTRQIYPVILCWTLILIALALWLRQTPLGLLARAIRNNDERVGFLGFDAASVRFRVIILSGMLAAAAGAMSAMIYEIVSVESVSIHNSANVLIMTVVGGAGNAFGPLVGAVLLTFLQTVLSRITSAWPMYYGLIFVAIILGCPSGLTEIFARPQFRQPRFVAGILLRGSGAVIAIEWLYHVREGAALSQIQLYGAPLVAAITLIASFILVKPPRAGR